MTQNSPLKVSPNKQLQRLDEKEYKKANSLNLQASTIPAWANMFNNDNDDEESSPKLKGDSSYEKASEATSNNNPPEGKINAPKDGALPIEGTTPGSEEMI